MTHNPDECAVFRAVVAQHIADGVTSRNPAAAVLARSLQTELDLAGVNIDADVKAATECKQVSG
jgi:hypothetical protein